MSKLVLASGSPRRKELLENVGIQFDVVKSEIEEQIDHHLPPEQIVMELALQKAKDVSRRYREKVVLGADTIVTYENRILGKPANEEEAKRMLAMLSGRVHTVYTGVAIVTSSEVKTFYESTDVTFWQLSDEEIEAYFRTEEPMDKAGAYGIQRFGSILVKRISGDYFTVVGLPIASTVRELKRFGVTPAW